MLHFGTFDSELSLHLTARDLGKLVNSVLDKKHTITGTVLLYYICIMHQSIVILPPTSGKSGANVRHFSSSVISGVPDYVGDFFCIAPRPLYVAKADPGEGPGGPGPTPFSGLN